VNTKSDYAKFFEKATGHSPYPYQTRLSDGPWPDLLDVPTGLGKTAAVTLAWLYRRQELRDPDTPRRLVWCFPMRVLVEQTRAAVEDWLNKLDCHGKPGDGKVSVHLLMGGEPDVRAPQWASYPEENAILIGTQDMLLSRALMRGYGMSRYQWPVHYALLHNDALWVFDEVQLMGPALPTSTQLEAFRRKLHCFSSSRSLWVSATLREDWLDTVDFRPFRQQGLQAHTLSDKDRSEDNVKRRIHAPKALAKASSELLDRTKAGQAAYIKVLAAEIREAHQAGEQTLIILNRVDRAQALYDALCDDDPDCLLLHARFRQAERKRIEEQLSQEPGAAGRVVIATQAVEAGVDMDSRVLFTELAPWTSLIQRFGRCNRAGKFDDATVYWINVDESERELALPYEADPLTAARQQLEQASSASPEDLPAVEEQPALTQVIRLRDLLELFNTDPDLSGFDVDVSPYIRDTGTPQLQVFWRDVDRDTAANQGHPQREELCPVSISQLRDHLGKKLPKIKPRLFGREHPTAWRFDTLEGAHREGRWVTVRAEDLRPGMIVMLAGAEGGYAPERGFSSGKLESVKHVPVEPAADEGMGDDLWTQIGRRVTLDEHLHDVAAAMETLAARLGIAEDERTKLVTASRWHDVGKAHEAFQRGLGFDPEDPQGPWAKSDRSGTPKYHCIGIDGEPIHRRGFRHELASMLAWIEHGNQQLPPEEFDLIAYLITAHHGRVRLGLRALPDEKEPPRNNGHDRLYARGVWEGDRLPALTAGAIELPETTLRLDLMKLGQGPQGPSWTERTRHLLERHGPFRLAWFEALVRIADWQASRQESAEADRGADQ